MKYIVILVILLSNTFALSQTKEFSVKSNLRVVIFEGDQYKKWYGRFHGDDSILEEIEDTSAHIAPQNKYQKKRSKKREKAFQKKQKARVFHEVDIPIEVVFKLNLDSLPVPIVSNILVKNFNDSLISFNSSEIELENVGPQNGNGYCSFRFHFEIENVHFRKNDKKIKGYPKHLTFSGHINFSNGQKGNVDGGLSGSVYKRDKYTVYRVKGKKYSFIHFVYRFNHDFEKKLEALKY